MKEHNKIEQAEYLNQKKINYMFSLNLSLLPEISKDYIFKQVMEYSKTNFLKKELHI